MYRLFPCWRQVTAAPPPFPPPHFLASSKAGGAQSGSVPRQSKPGCPSIQNHPRAVPPEPGRPAASTGHQEPLRPPGPPWRDLTVCSCLGEADDAIARHLLQHRWSVVCKVLISSVDYSSPPLHLQPHVTSFPVCMQQQSHHRRRSKSLHSQATTPRLEGWGRL
jgi:hypothetical protein